MKRGGEDGESHGEDEGRRWGLMHGRGEGKVGGGNVELGGKRWVGDEPPASRGLYDVDGEGM